MSASPDFLSRLRGDLRRRRAELLGKTAVEQGALSASRLEELWKSLPLDRLEDTLAGLTPGDVDPAPQEPAAPPLPLLLAHRYRIGEPLGEGAVSIVHRGVDEELGRPVAIKVLRESFTLQTAARERFLREAKALARMDHPHVVKVHDVGEEEGRLYLVLELVEGSSLQDLVERRLPDRGLDWALRALVKIARAVDHAHGKGIVHRDLKPENILVTAAGEPKVADFGLAQLSEPSASLTRTGAVLGTPLYMAPEQVRGDAGAIGPATDVYALGALLYRCAGGRPPHEAGAVAEVYGKILKEEAAPLRGVDWQLDAVARKALEKDPRHRYPTAAAFAEDLESYLKGEPIAARPLSAPKRAWRALRRHRTAALMFAGLALVAALGAGVWARDRARTKALSLLEAARPPLERMTAALYREDARFETLHPALSEARGLVEEAIRLSPDLPVAHHRRGEILELQGSFEAAEAAWRRAADLDPHLSAALFRLGRLLLWRAYLATTPLYEDPRGERLIQAERLAKEGAGFLARTEGFDSEIQRKAAAAMLRYLRNERAAARASCEEGIRDFAGKEGVEEFHWLAGLLEDKPSATIAAETQAVALKPGHALALYVRASAKLHSLDEPGLLADYDRALRASPDFPEARLYRGSAFLRSGKHREAVADFEHLIGRGELLAAAYNGRGYARIEADVDGALSDFNAALRLQPEHYALPYVGRGKIHLRKKDFAAAEADFTRALGITYWQAVHADRMKSRLLGGDRVGALDDLTRMRPSGWSRKSLEDELDRTREEFEKANP